MATAAPLNGPRRRTAPAGTRAHPELLPRSRSLLEAEQELIFERTWQLAGHVSSLPRPGSYITARAGSSRSSSCATSTAAAARLQERLPPPRLAAAERLGPVQGGDPLPLPRLDLQARRVADRRPRGHVVRRAPQTSRARPDAGPRRGDVRARVRQPRSRRDAAGRPGRRPAAAAGALPDRDAGSRSRPATGAQPANWKVVADNYLEGYHIPIAHPGPDADARLQALRRRGPRPLRLVRRADARQAEQQPARAPVRPAGHADARARRRATAASGATRSSTPTRRSTCIPTRSTPGSCCPTASAHTSDFFGCPTAPPTASPRTRLVQWVNQRLNTWCSTRTSTSSTTSSRVCRRGATAAARCRAGRPAVAWFADRIRADLAPALTERRAT